MEREYFEKFEFKSDHLSSISLSLSIIYPSNDRFLADQRRAFSIVPFFFFLISRLSLDLYYFSRWKLGSFFLFSSFFPLYYFFLFFYFYFFFSSPRLVVGKNREPGSRELGWSIEAIERGTPRPAFEATIYREIGARVPGTRSQH